MFSGSTLTLNDTARYWINLNNWILLHILNRSPASRLTCKGPKRFAEVKGVLGEAWRHMKIPTQNGKFFWIRIHFCIGTCAAVAKCRKFRCASDRKPQGPLGPFLLRYPSSVSSGNWSIGITWPQGLAQSFHSATTGIPRCVQGEWPGWCCVATGHKPPNISKIRRMFTVWCVMRVAFLHTLQFGHSSGGEALKDVFWTVPVFFLTKNSKTWAR